MHRYFKLRSSLYVMRGKVKSEIGRLVEGKGGILKPVDLSAVQIRNWTHPDPVLAHAKKYLLRR